MCGGKAEVLTLRNFDNESLNNRLLYKRMMKQVSWLVTFLTGRPHWEEAHLCESVVWWRSRQQDLKKKAEEFSLSTSVEHILRKGKRLIIEIPSFCGGYSLFNVFPCDLNRTLPGGFVRNVVYHCDCFRTKLLCFSFKKKLSHMFTIKNMSESNLQSTLLVYQADVSACS